MPLEIESMIDYGEIEIQKVLDIVHEEKCKALERCGESVLMKMEIITIAHDITTAIFNENLKRFKRPQ